VITGCGTSHGNPPWGYRELWSEDPRDHRRRSGAALLGPRGAVILIDTGPDLAHQLRDPYKEQRDTSYPERCIVRCDGVLLTHDHADHTHGLNELRHLNRLMRGTGITIHGCHGHLDQLRAMYPYCFGDGSSGGYHLAAPLLETIHRPDHVTFTVCNLPITPFAMDHGPSGRVTGYRIGSLAYCTDCKSIPEDSLSWIADCELLVLDMLRAEPHVSHYCWEDAEALIMRVRPRRTVLVHMGHEVRYAEWADRLPPGVELAYDGWHADFTAAPVEHGE